MKRAVKEIIRNPMQLKNQLANVIVTIIIIGWVFYMAAKDPPP